MKTLILVVTAAISLSACAPNGYEQFYSPNANLSAQVISERRVAPPTSTPELIHGTDPKTDILNMQADGFAVIGSAGFNGPEANDEGALKQAQAVGADRVVVFSHYSGTLQSTLPITTPTTQTSFSNVSGNVFGMGGSETFSGMGTTTTYGTQTTYIPISVNRFDYLAVFMVRLRSVFGVYWRNLTPQESQSVGSVNGVALIVVVRGSPAATAGLLPGDILLKVNSHEVTDQSELNSFFSENQDKSISVTIFRNGATISKTVQLAHG